MENVDLAVAGGTVVSANGRRRAHLLVRDGRVVGLTTERFSAQERVDAEGLLVLPGGVDAHVHLMDPGDPAREDFVAGSAAAAVAGTTTVLEHTHSHPIRTVADLQEKRRYLAGRSYIDYGLGAHAWPQMTDEVAPLWREGASFFKVFTCTTHGVPGHDASALSQHLKAQSAVGAMSLVHCEDESLVRDAEQALRALGRLDGGIVTEWRTLTAELVAVSVVALLVRLSGARASIAHVSNPEVATIIARARAAGARLAAEACPQYFLLRESEVAGLGPLRKFTPPVRARSNADEGEMWHLLRDGTLSYMASDHAPSTRLQKGTGDIWSCPFGLPGLDTTMPILLDSALSERISLEDAVRVYSEAPARYYGLLGRKGCLVPGADADFIIVDPEGRRTLADGDVLSKAGWTPYAGRVVRGKVLSTYVRGRLVAQEGKVVGERVGRYLPGPGAEL